MEYDYIQVSDLFGPFLKRNRPNFDPKLPKIGRNCQNPVLGHLIDPCSFPMDMNDFRHTYKAENHDYWQVLGSLRAILGVNLAKLDLKLLKIGRNRHNPVLGNIIDPYSSPMGINDSR